MDPQQTKTQLSEIEQLVASLIATARVANRNRQSLNGDNYYGHKFHELGSNLCALVGKIERSLRSLDWHNENKEEFFLALDEVAIPQTPLRTRIDAARIINRIAEGSLSHALISSDRPVNPTTEPVLPMSVVVGTRGYFEKPILYANGCYINRWFDPCSVMIRKFVELLIIEVFEANHRSDSIQSPNGQFMMLRDLIDAALNETNWNLQTETKSTLPLIKTLGDRSAHKRRYLARRQDIDQVIPGLRIVADDLLHLAGCC